MDITAWSAISPYGLDRSRFTDGIRSGRAAMRWADPAGPASARACLVPGFDQRAVLGRKGTKGMDRMTGLAVVASETLFKNFRRRRTNWQARLLGRLDLMGDNITQWSRRASRPIQIDPTSPSSERPSTRPWYKQRRNTPITPACSNRPSGSLTSPKSLRRVVN